MILDCIVVGPIQCNCYIFGDTTSRRAFLIDPGAESAELMQYLDRNQWELTGIFITHCHVDHIGGLTAVVDKSAAPVHYHDADRFLFDDVTMQAALFGATPRDLQATQPAPREGTIQDEHRFALNSHTLRAIHTPGHTPGSTCFFAEGERLLFTGDTLFQGSIGRTDLWGGSFPQIIDSIQNRLMTLPDDVRVFPGHGPETTIGEERKLNPFLRGD